VLAHFTDPSHRTVSATLSSVSELETLIAELRTRPEPSVLFLERDGRCLNLGLGHPLSPMGFADERGATYHSVGDLSLIGTIPFWGRDSLDDFFADQGVPEAAAISAALQFAATGERPSGLHWEADW
jgi:Immunity protein Imm1